VLKYKLKYPTKGECPLTTLEESMFVVVCDRSSASVHTPHSSLSALSSILGVLSSILG